MAARCVLLGNRSLSSRVSLAIHREMNVCFDSSFPAFGIGIVAPFYELIPAFIRLMSVPMVPAINIVSTLWRGSDQNHKTGYGLL